MAAPTPTAPLLTALLCTRDRAGPLRLALESLARQTLPADAFEVVVVDDGSSDDTREVVRAFERAGRVRYSHQRAAGLASARNHGLFLARGTIVLFLAEEVAHPALLERHVEKHRAFPEPWYAVLGSTRLDPSLADDPLLCFLSEAGWAPFASPATNGDPLDFRHFRAERSSCKRAFLVENGVFNAALRDGGEDVELAHRLSRRGFALVHDPGAVSAFARRLTVDEACLEQYREGRASLEASRLLPGGGVDAGIEAAQAQERWRELGPVYPLILRSARELDRMARVRRAEGLPLDAHELSLLHRSYRAALAASQVKARVDATSP